MIKKGQKHYLIYTFLGIGSFIMLFPFAWSILTSLKSYSESMLIPPTFLPEKFSIESYVSVFSDLPFGRFFINTAIVILVRIILVCIFSSMAGYAFARLEFPGKDFLFILVLIPMMVPSQIFIYPQFLLVSRMGLSNTVTALIIPGIVSTFGIFLLRQFFMSLPKDMEEAAALDGCNVGQTFLFVMLPLIKSGLVSVSIFTALFAYKDLLWPLIVNSSIEKMPLTAGLATLQGQFSTNYPELMAGSVIAIFPMIIIFIVFQKQFVEGIASTGIKN